MPGIDTAPAQPGPQVFRLGALVAFALEAGPVVPVAQIVVTQAVAEQRENAVLGLSFDLPDGANAVPNPPRLPDSASCEPSGAGRGLPGTHRNRHLNRRNAAYGLEYTPAISYR
jgi:hypothetical protein